MVGDRFAIGERNQRKQIDRYIDRDAIIQNTERVCDRGRVILRDCFATSIGRVESEHSGGDFVDFVSIMKRDFGYRFCPTDEELVTEFLWKKKIDPAVIVQRDLYGENRAPWQLLKEEGVDPWQVIRVWDKDSRRIKIVEKAIYVVTALNKAKDTHKRIRREAGCGTWHGETGVHEIFDLSGHLIGYKKMFTFTVPADDPIFQGDDNNNCSSSSSSSIIQGHWIMHEYTLAGASKPTTAGTDEYALCKIMFDEAKCLKKSPPKNKKRKKDTAASTSTSGDNEDDHHVQQRRRCVTATAPTPAPAVEQPQPMMTMPRPTTGCESDKDISANNATVDLPPPLQSFEEESLPSNFDDELRFERVMLLQPPNATRSCFLGLDDDNPGETSIAEWDQMLMAGEPSMSIEELMTFEPEESINCRGGGGDQEFHHQQLVTESAVSSGGGGRGEQMILQPSSSLPAFNPCGAKDAAMSIPPAFNPCGANDAVMSNSSRTRLNSSRPFSAAS